MVPNKSQKRGCRRQGRLGWCTGAAPLGDGCAALADLGHHVGKTKHHGQQHAMGARLLGLWAPSKSGWAWLPDSTATQSKGFHVRPAWEGSRGHRSHQFPALQGQVQRGRSELLLAIDASVLTPTQLLATRKTLLTFNPSFCSFEYAVMPLTLTMQSPGKIGVLEP